MHTCLSKGCDKKHHTLLHGYFTDGKEAHLDGKQGGTRDGGTTPDPAQVKNKDAKAEKDDFVGMVRSRKKETFLQIVLIVLHSDLAPDIETYALLDDGSQSTEKISRSSFTSGETGGIECFDCHCESSISHPNEIYHIESALEGPEFLFGYR